jgi:hypothetical protein
VATQYLVPCTCGRKTPVESRQAGETIECDCGAKLEIPRLLELKKLEKAVVQAEPEKKPPPWGIGQGLVLFSVVILIGVGVLWMGALHFLPGNPYDMSPEWIRAHFQKMSPVETWETWRYFEQVGINPPKERIDRYFEGEYAKRQMLLMYLGIAAVGGVALLASGIFLAARQRSKRSSTVSR